MTKFINPYNFVPLYKDYKDEADVGVRNLSGVIEYSLLTKTPLFIPNTSNDHAILPQKYKESGDYHKSYEFFAYENLEGSTECKKEKELKSPVIPGSEIRGMLRSNYEIMTNSCMSSMDDTVLSRRNCHVFKAGLLRNVDHKTFELYKDVTDCLFRTKAVNNLQADLNWKDDKQHNTRKCYVQKDLAEGQKVYVSLDPQRSPKAKPVVTKLSTAKYKNAKEGYVIKGQDGPDMSGKKNQKHCCHVFLKPGASSKKSIVSLKILEIAIKEYQKHDEKAYREYEQQLKKFKETEGAYFPVYYSIVGNYCMLSPASITREIYQTKSADLTKSHEACDGRGKLCPACSLFGMVAAGKTNFAVSSRIRVTDMKLVDNKEIKEIYEKPVRLKELSSPKLSNVEFYLKRPKDAWFWTYDYYIGKDGNPRPYSAEMNGRKFYWHNLNTTIEDVCTDGGTDEGEERKITVRPVKKNNKFTGKIYFDGISENELKKLIYLINLGETEPLEQKKHGYKLGTGKPLGMGSVALSVDQVKIRKMQKNDTDHTIETLDEIWDFSSVSGNDVWDAATDSELMDAYEKMTAFDTLDKFLSNNSYEYSYPYKIEDNKNEGKECIFGWFVDNHRGYKENKKTHVKERNKMPNNRNQLYFESYMEAMNPQLQSTGTGIADTQKAGMKGKGGHK